MHFQEILNDSVQLTASMIKSWEENAADYEEKIEHIRKQGQPVAGMETSLSIQRQRIKVIKEYMITVDRYIHAMHEEFVARQKNAINTIPEGRSELQRIRICDLPAGENQNHIDVMEKLYTIEELIRTIIPHYNAKKEKY
jgi:hypothetical protein